MNFPYSRPIERKKVTTINNVFLVQILKITLVKFRLLEIKYIRWNSDV